MSNSSPICIDRWPNLFATVLHFPDGSYFTFYKQHTHCINHGKQATGVNILHDSNDSSWALSFDFSAQTHVMNITFKIPNVPDQCVDMPIMSKTHQDQHISFDEPFDIANVCVKHGAKFTVQHNHDIGMELFTMFTCVLNGVLCCLVRLPGNMQCFILCYEHALWLHCDVQLQTTDHLLVRKSPSRFIMIDEMKFIPHDFFGHLINHNSRR
jgi:hypothetical protein